MEENFVSQDIQVEILMMLYPRDIFSFSLTSKMAHRICDRVWLKKFVNEFGQIDELTVKTLVEYSEKQESEVKDGITFVDYLGNKITWYGIYVNACSKCFTFNLNISLDVFQKCQLSKNRGKLFRKILELIVSNHWLMSLKRYQGFIDTVQAKLIDIQKEVDVEDYYKILFPSSYLDHYSLNLNTLFGES